MSARDPARGRPRDPRTERDIMGATRRLLARDGYDQVTIDAIAREAGGQPAHRLPALAVQGARGFRRGVRRRRPPATCSTGSGDFDADLRRSSRGAARSGANRWWRPPPSASSRSAPRPGAAHPHPATARRTDPSPRSARWCAAASMQAYSCAGRRRRHALRRAGRHHASTPAQVQHRDDRRPRRSAVLAWFCRSRRNEGEPR